MKLKECPFCGKEANVQKTSSMMYPKEFYYYPRCYTTDCVGNQGWVSFRTEDAAVKAWNKRQLTSKPRKFTKPRYDEIYYRGQKELLDNN